jgi:hypothetical protein
VLVSLVTKNCYNPCHSGQWATIAVEAEELVAAIKARVETKSNSNAAKNSAVTPKQSGKKISPTVSGKAEDKTAHKTAKLFNTNSTYVNQAAVARKAG